MLVAAFVGWVAGVFAGAAARRCRAGPDLRAHAGPDPRARCSRSLSGLDRRAVHAWLSISVRADQIISGTIINIAAFGHHRLPVQPHLASSPAGAGAFARFEPPTQLVDLPVRRLDLRHVPVPGPDRRCRCSSWSSSSRCCSSGRAGACGRGRSASTRERPRRSASTSSALRYRNVIVGGVLAALGGAFLSMEVTGSFTAGHDRRPRVHRARGHDHRPLDAARAHSAPRSSSPRRRPSASPSASLRRRRARRPPGQLPGQFFDALPYIVTIVVLAGVVGRSIPPAADGQPYEREATT